MEIVFFGFRYPVFYHDSCIHRGAWTSNIFLRTEYELANHNKSYLKGAAYFSFSKDKPFELAPG